MITDYVLTFLCSTAVQRPVQVPIGSLVKFITALLSSSTDRQVFAICTSTHAYNSLTVGKIDGYVDPLVRSLEISAVPSTLNAGAELVTQLART